MARQVRSDEQIHAEIASARARKAGTPEPRAVEARYDESDGRIVVTLTNGCLFAFPAGEARGLEGATADQLADVIVEQDGEALHFESIDADVSVPGLVARLLNLQVWAPRLLGQRTSAAKSQAARDNGAKGGRPRREATMAKKGTVRERSKPKV